MPDGQTIDADGNLWVAVFNGHSVLKIDPKQPETLLYTLKLPAKQVRFKYTVDYLTKKCI